MKISNRALAYISILAGASTAAAETCLSGSFKLEYEGDCDRETLIEVFDDQVFSPAKSAACDGVTAEQELDAQLAAAVPSTTIEEFCAKIYKDQYEVPFTDILRKDENMTYEKAFFLGHSHLQEEVETTYETADGSATSVLKEDGELVRVHFQGSAQTKKTEWPKLPNFASSDTDSLGQPTCTTSAAMCCWTKDRQANDNNGNCARNTYSKNCVDKDPGDNTNLCYVDMERGEVSTGNAAEGLVAFPDDNGNGEGAIHCHGLAWANDVNDASARYKGNNIFFVSMYDHMYQRGYVENVPGAPMCGCVEQMPTVTRSDCTEIDATERFRITFDGTSKELDGSITLVDINFNACQGINNRNNDLWAYMGRLFYEGKINNRQWGEAGRIITNDHDCKTAVRAQYDVMGLEYGYDYDVSTFTFVAGRGELKETEKYGHQAFATSMFEHSLTAPSNKDVNPLDKTPVLLRTCAECRDTHKKVYYRRLTPMPEDKDLLYCITETRGNCDGKNVWNQDFTLHSTYEDAVSGDNPWSCPNNAFNYNAPFDGECSPTGARVMNQWTVIHWSNPPQKNVGYYVNKPQDAAIEEVEYVTESALRSSAGEFVSEDVGLDVRVKGRVRLDEDGKIYITGSGHNVWHNNDGFQFYHKDATGDFNVTVNVASFDNIMNSNAKAGIMFRSTTDHDSGFVSALLSGGKGLRFQKRSSKGNWAHNVGTFEPNPHRENVWLRLVKKMTTVDMYWSEDGETWTQGGSTTMLFPDDTFQLGLFVNSHESGWQAEATFENFDVDSYEFPSAAPSISAAPTAWDPEIYVGETQENVGYSQLSATQTKINNDAGSGIDGDVDSFYYHAYQRLSSSAFEATMHTDYFYGTDGAKGGIMIRDGTGVSAANAFIGIYPADSTGVITQSRVTEGGETVRHKSLWVSSNKAFLKLKYDGAGTVTMQYKTVETDEWEDIENSTMNITFGDKLYIGVAATGGGWNNYIDFRYSNFEITDL